MNHQQISPNQWWITVKDSPTFISKVVVVVVKLLMSGKEVWHFKLD